MREEAAREVTKMLQAFVPAGFIVDIHENEHEVPGFPHSPPYLFRGYVRDGRKDAEGRSVSDAHFVVSARSREGAVAKLLAAILDGAHTPFFPMT